MGQAKDPTHSCGGLDKDYTWVWGGLQDEHAVAVGEEAVAGGYGVGIGGEGGFTAGGGAEECTDEHEESGLREMEVGDETLDDAEFVTRAEEDFCGAGV